MAEGGARRVVRLRAEHHGDDWRYLSAWKDDQGNLYIDGQDVGPRTRAVSDAGVFGWSLCIERQHLHRLSALLGGDPYEDVLDTLERGWRGRRSYDLEDLLDAHTEDVPAHLGEWS